MKSKLLEDYLASIKPSKKRESEAASLKSLLGDYAIHDVETALASLIESGTPGSGEPSHSPMSYLSHAMEQVLGEVRGKASKAQERESRAQAVETAEARRLAQEQREAQAEALREKAYFEAFPTDELRQAWIEKISLEYPALRGCGNALKSLAITAWYSRNGQHTKGTEA